MNEEKEECAKRFDASVASCGLDANNGIIKSVRESYIMDSFIDEESVIDKARCFTGEPFPEDLPRPQRKEIKIDLDTPKKRFFARFFGK